MHCRWWRTNIVTMAIAMAMVTTVLMNMVIVTMMTATMATMAWP